MWPLSMYREDCYQLGKLQLINNTQQDAHNLIILTCVLADRYMWRMPARDISFCPRTELSLVQLLMSRNLRAKPWSKVTLAHGNIDQI